MCWRLAGASTASPGDDWQAQGVAIDTRDLLAGDIFVALPGEKAHGHDYVAQAFKDGAAAALVGADFDAAGLKEDAVLLPVVDVLAALKAWRAPRANAVPRKSLPLPAVSAKPEPKPALPMRWPNRAKPMLPSAASIIISACRSLWRVCRKMPNMVSLNWV